MSSATVTRRLAIARRELASLKSEKTIVLALLIQLFVAAFSGFLVVGLVSMYDPGSMDGFTLQVGVTGEASGELAATLAEQEGVAPRTFGSQADATRAFHDERVDVVLVASYTDDHRIDVLALVPDESVRTTMYVVQLQQTFETFERNERVERVRYLDQRPIDPPEKVSSSPYFGFTYTVLIPLLMFLPIFISGSIAVDSMTEEIQRGTLELLRVAPVTLWDIVDAKLLATATLAPFQAAAWLWLLSLNGTKVAHPVGILFVVGGLSLAVVVVGLAISLLAPDRRQAQFLYSSGVLGVVALTTLLPEHPANTIARLSIGSVGATTWPAVAGYVGIGVACYLGMRVLVARTNPEGL